MPKTIAIMQPTYFPWLGYLAMIERVDQFVFLDNVQFDYRSWQQRNRIKTLQGELWLTISVKQKGLLTQKINEVTCIDLKKDIKKHLSSITHYYRRSENYDELYPKLSNFLQDLVDTPLTRLVDLNIRLINFLCNYAQIKCNFICANDLNVSGQKGTLLTNICEALKAENYLAPPGSRVYIDTCEDFAKKNINIIYHNYQHPVYTQLFGEFITGMSCLDAFLNIKSDHLKSLIMSGCV